MIEITGNDLSVEDIVQVARNGVKVGISADSIKKIEINCYGSIDDIKPMSIALIKGLLSEVVYNRVNYTIRIEMFKPIFTILSS